MKSIFYLMCFCTSLIILSILSCSLDGTLSDDADVILCPTVQQYMTAEQCSIEVSRIDSIVCANQPTNIKGAYKEKYQKSPVVYHYTYDIPGGSTSNCDFKFLESANFDLKVDSVNLVRYGNHNVGNAMYKVYKIEYTNPDTRLFWLKQIRETYMGVYNNDGVCDGGSSPFLPYFYVRMNKCHQYASIGDTYGLKAIYKN